MKRIALAGIALALEIVSAQAEPALQEEVDLHHGDMLQASEGILLGTLQDEKTQFAAAGLTGEGGTKPDGDTLFEIGSITKVFTALLLAESVREGKCALDDPITNFLPEGTVAKDSPLHSVTLEDLATHTSGFPRLPDNLAEFEAGEEPEDWTPYSTYTPEQLATYLATVTADNLETRGEWAYSNFGYGLLGYLLERLWETPYDQLVTERIFEPLGMTSSFVQTSLEARPTELVSRIATGHVGGEPTTYWEFTSTTAGAGAIVSSANDLFKFALAHWHPKAPQGLAESLKVIAESRHEMPDGERSMCLGWLSEGSKLRHSGGTGGFRSLLEINPLAKSATISLINSGQMSTDEEISGDFAPLAGFWSGTLAAGQQKLRLVLRIRANGRNDLFSIDQGAAPMSASKSVLEGEDIFLTFPEFGGLFKGTLSGDELVGTWNQGRELPLSLKREADVPEALTKKLANKVSGDLKPLEGFWSGRLGEGKNSLLIVCQIEALGNTSLVQIFSPDQHHGAIGVGKTTFADDQIKIAIPILEGQFQGKLTDEKTIEGTWTQGQVMPLTMEWSKEKPVSE